MLSMKLSLPMVALEISPCTDVTLTFDFDFGLDRPDHGGMDEGAQHREDEVTVKKN
jgi:hypothetical protein